MYVLIEPKAEGIYTASLIGMPMMAAQGQSENEALTKLRTLVAHRLQAARIVPLEIELPATMHPWLEHADRLRANPLFAEVREAIQIQREQDEEYGSGCDIGHAQST
ncbi:hypothetical protein CJ255_13625 [Candidatus Viridilinea mediisalina]|uniref:HicB family protein n=2 Tax=Candidatus Viridilinea mediisalina TaxID=2024553 RepID=A0A2A6RHZ8_9CHLR|nr:hypothetical protein CJ255_13625 [Candidatus Viridilinea mediisalina]